jgi:hypothetical protein
MPYIKKLRREELEKEGYFPSNVGELNYILTLISREYMETKGLSYQTINDIIGALEGAKLEFYRRIASPYEDEKITENGDVY